MLTTRTPIKALSIAAFALVAVTGCGKGGVGSLVSNVSVQTYQQDGDLWGELKAQLSTLGMVIAGLNVPIRDPGTGAILGQISINNSFCGSAICPGSQIDVQMDIAKVTHSNANLLTTLPNGTPIPVGGLGSTPVVGFPVGGSGADLYVGIGPNVAVLGVALPFAEFNHIGQYVPGVDLFDPFSSGKVNGVVGLFTGSGSGQNGIALFVDASGLLNASTIQAQSPGSAPAASVMRMYAQSPATHLVMQKRSPSSSSRYMIYYLLDNIDRHHPVLHLQ